MTTKLQKWGNSYAVRIPKHLVQGIKLAQGSEIEIKYYNQSLVIKPKKQKEYALKELVKGITPKNRHKIIFDGPDIGKEKTIW
jgi:antitoxin MazE